VDPKALLETGVAAVAPDWTAAEWSATARPYDRAPAGQVLGQNFWIALSTAGEVLQLASGRATRGAPGAAAVP
jgi:hypothetical protein